MPIRRATALSRSRRRASVQISIVPGAWGSPESFLFQRSCGSLFVFMIGSCEITVELLLNPVNLHCGISRREAGNLGDLRRSLSLQIEQDDLPVQGSEPVN